MNNQVSEDKLIEAVNYLAHIERLAAMNMISDTALMDEKTMETLVQIAEITREAAEHFGYAYEDGKVSR